MPVRRRCPIYPDGKAVCPGAGFGGRKRNTVFQPCPFGEMGNGARPGFPPRMKKFECAYPFGRLKAVRFQNRGGHSRTPCKEKPCFKSVPEQQAGLDKKEKSNHKTLFFRIPHKQIGNPYNPDGRFALDRLLRKRVGLQKHFSRRRKPNCRNRRSARPRGYWTGLLPKYCRALPPSKRPDVR